MAGLRRRALLLLFSFLCCAHSMAEWFSDTQPIMGTEINVTLWHTDAEKARKLIAASMEEMHRINRTLSPYIETSDLAKLNKSAAKAPQPISDEMVRLIDKSLYFSKLSRGSFDITFASVGWFYDYREKKQPTIQKRDELLPAINFRLLNLDRQNKTLAYGHKNIRIDLGGIAKGYAVDRVAEMLTRAGVTSATVSAGGDSRIIGDKRGKPWMIGIKNPRGPQNAERQHAIVLPLENTAVSTSGDYERYFLDEKTGERIHHIINPRTGKSAKGIASVTILGPQGLDTDPMSTTVFVLGVDHGLTLVNSIPGFDCIIIDSAGKVHYSNGLVAPKS